MDNPSEKSLQLVINHTISTVLDDYGTVRQMVLSKNNLALAIDAAIRRAVEEERKRVIEDIRKYLNAYCYQDDTRAYDIIIDALNLVAKEAADDK